MKTQKSIRIEHTNQAALDLLSAIQAEVVPDVVPDVWFTVEQLCKVAGLSDNSVLRRVKQGVKDGKCECKRFKIKLNSQTRAINHYHKL